MNKLFVVLICFYSCIASAQSPVVKPAGGGGYLPAPAQCVTNEERAAIEKMLDANKKQLVKEGKLIPAGLSKTTSQTFDWPLQQAPGFNYYNLYGISNYVDLDTTYPNHVLDWNCGSRTYDLTTGYNHAGTDIFLWPFGWNMMLSNQAQIIAAAPGVIIGKYDGNPDHDCGLNDLTSWNAVYIQHADGTVAWYGHMKTNTQTTKNIGDTIAAGEYLGQVGSSGSSTGPHLHFEVHDVNGNVTDPFHGSCNTVPSLWNTQKPYYEPGINTLMTHFAPPGFATCPGLDTINAQDTFAQGSDIYFAAYYHDQLAGQVADLAIYRPDSTVFQAWSFADTTAWYAGSYWYWEWQYPSAEQGGKWSFKVNYQGNEYMHYFYLLPSVGVNNVIGDEGSYSLYPNPAGNSITIVAPHSMGSQKQLLAIYDMSGKLLLSTEASFVNGTEQVALHLAPGIYALQLTSPDGVRCIQKLRIQ